MIIFSLCLQVGRSSSRHRAWSRDLCERNSPKNVITLMLAVKTSDSPNHRTEHMLSPTMATRPTVIVTAGVRSVQKATSVAAAESSEAIAICDAEGLEGRSRYEA